MAVATSGLRKTTSDPRGDLRAAMSHGPQSGAPHTAQRRVPGGNQLVAASAGMGDYVRDPNYRPPPAAPPPAATVTPPSTPPTSSYQPPSYTRDPRIEELLRELQRGNGAAGQSSVGTLDLSGIERQSGQLKALLAQLMRGEGVKVGDLSNDPAQRAYELKTQRAGERLRESEAARSGATGGADAGGFDGRVAQIMTETGEANASNMADLINKRRAEKLTTAITGANLQMSDLQRQASNRTAEHGSLMDRERLRLAGDAAKGADRQRLLEALMMEDRQRRESQERGNYYDRDQTERRRIEEREQTERLRQEELKRNPPPAKPVVPYNPYGYNPLRGW